MAFPVSARTTGELITASIWNADIKDNMNTLRAGGVAIASQAANDVIIASSASQLSRLAAGTGVLQTSAGGAPAYTQSPALASPTVSTLIDNVGGQIKFPATQVASADVNTMDDYEEGTWTLTLTGSSSGSFSSYTTREAYYLKIGLTVYIWFYVFANVAGTCVGNAQISGLPFAASGTGSFPGVVMIPYWANFGTSRVQCGGLVGTSASVIALYEATGATGTSAIMPATSLNINSITLVGFGRYRAAA